MTNEDKQWFEARFEKMVETMRDMQTEILRGFRAHSDGLTIRLRKIEADQSNLDVALSRRVEVLEQRLLEIETRLDHTKGDDS
ncbi:MAG TPA: hypothetical protein VIX37_13205 [Candidatus Sulfotelmatobacter sp.]